MQDSASVVALAVFLPLLVGWVIAAYLLAFRELPRLFAHKPDGYVNEYQRRKAKR